VEHGNNIDMMTLSWFVPEIRESLQHVAHALDELRANPHGQDAIKRARLHLHQTHGALQVAGISGVALLTEEAEHVISAFEDGVLEADESSIDVLKMVMRPITEYLEDMQASGTSIPVLVLYPYYRDLVGLRKAVQDDTTLVHTVIAHGPVERLNAIVTPLALLGCAFWIDWRLALLAVSTLVLYVLTYSVSMRGMNEKTVEMDRKLAAISSAMVEFVSGIGVVKAFGRVGRAHSAYLAAADEFSAFYRARAMPPRPMHPPRHRSKPISMPAHRTARLTGQMPRMLPRRPSGVRVLAVQGLRAIPRRLRVLAAGLIPEPNPRSAFRPRLSSRIPCSHEAPKARRIFPALCRW